MTILFADSTPIETTNTQPQIHNLLDLQTIYYEPQIIEYTRGQEILAKFPNAERIAVPSHWQIPGLHGNEGLVEDWIKIKRTVLVLGVKKSLSCLAYSRSCDWVAPSQANGCAMACAYCYVPRRKGYANPITTFVNIEQISGYLERHAARQGTKSTPTMADPHLWVYELGCNNDCAVDATICDNIPDLIALFRHLPNAKATFATKYVNCDLLRLDPQGKTRIRFSLLPPDMARLVDVRASSVAERIGAINDFVEAGYEVNLNFGPIILSDTWRRDYKELFTAVNDTLTAPVKAQLAAEVIFLTHNEGLHEVNLRWHPKAEAMLWRPDLQEAKISETGGHNVRYKLSLKRGLVAEFCALLTQHLPYCHIRYAF